MVKSRVSSPSGIVEKFNQHGLPAVEFKIYENVVDTVREGLSITEIDIFVVALFICTFLSSTTIHDPVVVG